VALLRSERDVTRTVWLGLEPGYAYADESALGALKSVGEDVRVGHRPTGCRIRRPTASPQATTTGMRWTALFA
jgi:hypothetical protein